MVKTEVEGGPRGFRGGEDRKEKTEFCGECWSCGGCHRSDRCENRWRRQLANAVRRLVQVGKDVSLIASEVRDMMGQVMRTKQRGPAAVEVVELPRPRPKEGGGEQASVHAIAEERRPKAKAGQAKPRGGRAKEEVTGAGDMNALRTLSGRRVDRTGEGSEGAAGVHEPGGQASASADGEGVEGACDDGSTGMVHQADERMGALEVGLAAQVQRAEESMSEIKLQRVWVEGELKDGAMAVQVESEADRGTGMGLAARVQRAAESMSEIRLQRDAEESMPEIERKHVGGIMADIESRGNQRNNSLLEEGGKLQGRLRVVEDRPDMSHMTKRIERIERSMLVCMNSVRVLHSYAEANGSSDSDRQDT